jgi:hypothetical protein
MENNDIRSAALEEAAIACENERVDDTGTDGDIGYNQAIRHAATAIRALSSAPAISKSGATDGLAERNAALDDVADLVWYWGGLDDTDQRRKCYDRIIGMKSAAPAKEQGVAPTVKQLTTQLADDKPWTVVEQQAFAVFLARFPNESSQGIMSLGDAWKAGRG